MSKMRRASRIITSSASNLRTFASRSFALPRNSFTTLIQTPQRQSLPGVFLKWGSLGSVRASSFASGFSPLNPKPLDSIIDIQRVKDRSPEDIASAWDDYHLGRGHIGASMKASLYHLLEHRAADCQYFVIPLWRGSGYVTMFAQACPFPNIQGSSECLLCMRCFWETLGLGETSQVGHHRMHTSKTKPKCPSIPSSVASNSESIAVYHNALSCTRSGNFLVYRRNTRFCKRPRCIDVCDDAHSLDELVAHSHVKIKLCRRYQSCYCPEQPCPYAHGDHELRQ